MVVENYQFRIRYSGWIAALYRKSDWNREIETPSWIAPMLLWKREFRPVHFTLRAQNLYGYEKRSGQDAPRGSKAFWRAYFGQKLRKLRHGKPLVYSGETERETARGVIRASARGAKYQMSVTKARWRPRRAAKYKTGPPPDMEEEMTRLTHAEIRAMIREKERDMLRRIREVRTVVQRTIGFGN